MKFIYILLIALLSGCASQGINTLNYQEHKKVDVPNEITVNAPYSEVWDILVRDLAKSFYIINNIDKESRIINVSFASTEPAEFADCGKSVRTYTEGKQTERYEYDVAGSSSYKIAADRQEHPAFSNYGIFNREVSLEGRSNIYVAPLSADPTKTTVSVNSRYVLDIKVKGQAYAKHISGNVQSRGSVPESTTTISFNTNGETRKDFGGGVFITCFSKEKLETDIINIVSALNANSVADKGLTN